MYSDKLNKNITKLQNSTTAMANFEKEVEMLGSLYNPERIEKMLQGKTGEL